uniref:Uncharacterized protein AlNc14C30G2825 n=1 Tax=Albugo laibachii Nc14 TaxID=890382 RepID=F0W7L9_9STRA|nr:conserved hypothetical protein [Albugo laibachii Nc14]|eukprot:CCA17120.1 conserved hypothetical protein [Albugo laibachii Nc14]
MPGQCKDDSTCKKKAPGYACVSVQTTRERVRDVKQCLPNVNTGDTCTGTTPGLCPSFATWPTTYKSISAVCAYILPDAKCAEDGDAKKRGTVNCLELPDDSGDTISVIFGCVDSLVREKRLLFEKKSTSDKLAKLLDYPTIISKMCVNPNASDILCSGQGTCGPKNQGSLNFTCLCNVGYAGKFCQRIDSNRCTNEGQCAAGTCNLSKQECECEEGTTGNQCAFCDPSSPKACNGKGSCNLSATRMPRRLSVVSGSMPVSSTLQKSNTSEKSTTNSKGIDPQSNTNAGSAMMRSQNGNTPEGFYGTDQQGGTCMCSRGWNGAQCDRSPVQNSTTTPSQESTSGARGLQATHALISTLIALALFN